MAVFKCKMCGGELEIQEGLTVCECEYCGTTQTIPLLDNEKKMTLFNRANKLRFNNEFDKASAVYENIVAEFPEEAEGYWGLVLCKYGIEYVDDKKTAKKIPTCHRTVPSPVTKDDDFKKAIECADVVAQKLYKEEAKAIDKLQKQILKIVESEEPYDVFICYKETDSKGKRTDDSTIAQDIYTELVKADYKVFFARVTLRDKAGSDYEPYIYSALSSSKVMLAIGTKEEYYDAVWVKNEWSRYLSMMSDDKSKHLIPCYKDIDAYDIPDDFKNLQALNMGDVTFYKDLMSAIEKFVPKKKEVVKETVVVSADNSQTAQIAPLLERVFMFLEDGDFSSANEYCEKVLDIDPKNALAYLGKLMADLKVKKRKELKKLSVSFEKNANYKKIVRFGDEKLKNELQGYIDFIIAGAETRTLTAEYNEAVKAMKSAKTEAEFKKVAKLFEKLKGFKDSEKRVEECLQKAAEVPLKKKYDEAVKAMKSAITVAQFSDLGNAFKKLGDYKDSESLYEECEAKVTELKEIAKKKQPILAEKRKNLSKANQLISAGEGHTVGLKSNGTVVAAGSDSCGKCKVKSWTDITAISAGNHHTVGLKSDGTVVATKYTGGKDYKGQCDVQDWTDIVAISTGYCYTVGLKSNGKVVAVGKNDNGQCNVQNWTGIVAISAGRDHTVGLKSDGTVVAVGKNGEGQCNVKSWTDIVAVSAGYEHTVGLKSDGTVVAAGSDACAKCYVKSWTDIVAVSAGEDHTVGLKSDGKVVAAGGITFDKCKVGSWTDIVAVSAGKWNTFGLKSDGTVVAVGSDVFGQCKVGSFKLFDDFEKLEEEKERIKAQKAQYRTQGLCQHCGGQLKGLFSKKCSNCGKPKDY